MKKLRKFLPIVLSIFVGGSIFTSCGGGGGSVSSNTEPSEGKESSLVSSEPENEHICDLKLIEKREPTCFEEGYEFYQCECGQMKEEFIEPTYEHKFGEWQIITEPSYESEGYEIRNCEVCHLEESRNTPMLEKPSEPDNPNDPIDPDNPSEEGHQEWHNLEYEMIGSMTHYVRCLDCNDFFVEEEHHLIKEDKYEHCKECGFMRKLECSHDFIFTYNDGFHYEFCIICSEVRNEVPHNFIEVPSEEEYICESSRFVSYYCDGCDFTKEELVTLQHDFSNYLKYNDMFCGKSCSYCGAFNTDSFREHQIDSSEVLLEPTYNTEGIRREHCSLCDDYRDIGIPTDQHNCNIEIVETYTPTCYRNGYYVYACTAEHCSNQWEEIYADRVDHDYVTTTIIEPTCLNPGEERVTCSYGCSYSKTNTIEPLGHEFEDDICTRCSYNQIHEYFEYSYYGDYYVIVGIKLEYFTKYCSEEKVVNFLSSYNDLPVKGINIAYNYYDSSKVEMFRQLVQCDLVVPEGVESFSITTADSEKYSWNNNKIYLPKSLTTIEGQYFDARDSLGNITHGAWNIYYSGTINDWLTNITISTEGSLPDINEFYTKEDATTYSLLENVVVDSSITTINNYALKGIQSLKSLVIPSTVQYIGMYAFEGCKNLEDLTIPFVGNTIHDNDFSFINYFGGWLNSLDKLVVLGGNNARVKELNMTSVDLSGVLLDGWYESLTLKNCVNLVDVKFPSDIDTINFECFYGCSSLKEIVIPEGVINIATLAFGECTSLESVSLPESLERIYDSVFHNCISLEEIYIPETVKEIYTDIFYGCINLTTVNLPGGLEKLSTHSSPIFKDCNITEFSITPSTNHLYGSLIDLFSNEGVKRLEHVEYKGNYIPDGFFENCENLKTINFSTTSLTSIGSFAFKNCYSLNNLPNLQVNEELGSGSFENCTSLSSINIQIPGNGHYTFKGCTSLITANVTLLNDNMFEDCTSLKTVNVTSEISLIPDFTFKNCSSLTQVICNNDLDSVGLHAFDNCSSLKEFDLSHVSSVIGASAFYKSGLTNIVLKGGVKVDFRAFAELVNTTNLEILESIDTGYLVFENTSVDVLHILGNISYLDAISSVNEIIVEGEELSVRLSCEGVSKVTLNEGLKTISNNALSLLNTLTEIEFPESLETIGDYSLPYSLEKITVNSPVQLNYLKFAQGRDPMVREIILNNQTEILSNQFSGLNHLVTLKSSLEITRVDDYAFNGCYALLNIPSLENISYLGNRAFDGCAYITKLVIHNDNLEFGREVFVNTSIKEIELNKVPEGFNFYESGIGSTLTKLTLLNETAIDNEQFRSMIKLEEVYLNEGIESIGSYAFAYNYNLKKFNLPSTVKSIGSLAFSSCQKLENITFGKDFESIGSYAFDGCYSLVEIRNLSSKVFTEKELKDASLIYVVNMIDDSQTQFGGVKQIGDYFYVNSVSLNAPVIIGYLGNGKDIVLPEKIENKGYYIGKYALALRTYRNEEGQEVNNFHYPLTSVTFSTNVIDIDYYILTNHTSNFKTLRINKVFDKINDATTFDSYDWNIDTIELLEGCTSIPNYGLFNFAGLKTLFIPSTVESIGDSYNLPSNYIYEVINLSNCELDRKHINVYTSREEYSSKIVKDDRNVYVYSIKDDKYYLVDIDLHGEEASNVDVVAPATFRGKEVVIYEFAFNRNANYHSITISEGIKTLCDNALNEVSVLTYIKIPSTIVNLGMDCMRYMRCETLYMPNFGEVEQGTFSYIGNDESGANTSIHFNGTADEWIKFARSNYLEYYHNPWYTVEHLSYLYCLDGNGVEYIVTEFDVSSYNWTTIESFFFSNYFGIEKVILPSTITMIDEGAFSRCISLKSINLPEGLVAIYDNAFVDTMSLESITFPSTLQVIRNCFNSSGLKNIVIPGNVKIIESSTFQNCMNLVSVTFEEGVTTVGNSAFYNCSSLTTVVLPTTLKTIGETAFNYCALNEVDLSNVTHINNHAFDHNTELTKVKLSSSCTFIGSRAFQNCGEILTIEFDGTQSEFESISKSDDWNATSSGKIINVTYK